jgi:hypothetical protein
MEMRTIWRIGVDRREQGYDLSDWNGKTTYQCNYTPDLDSNLPYQ